MRNAERIPFHWGSMMIRVAVIKNGEGKRLQEKAGLTGLLVDSSDALAREGQVVASFPQVFEAMHFKTHRPFRC
jgi:hypothetical protein